MDTSDKDIIIEGESNEVMDENECGNSMIVEGASNGTVDNTKSAESADSANSDAVECIGNSDL